ncbi:MAG: xanthine dehydrogenase family protein molybdopterin-binding subunit [Thermodesulfobacteriota bacterium]|nr:xanthine dehydrogenase family protein molybdopterin-binding subunit [Thermodesulfobacteriota bacterium]
MEEEYSIIGKVTPDRDFIPKLRGDAKFGADITVDGMLHGKILRSHHAHARILNIDTSRAERLPGVKAVITADDTPKIKNIMYCWLPKERFPGVESPPPEAVADQYILAVDRVRFIGEAVAAVAAVDEDTAEEALELIEVEYEPLPAVFDMEEALRPDAPQLHEASPGNVSGFGFSTLGDTEKGFRESDYIREDVFSFPLREYGLCEPHDTLADYDPISGKITIRGSLSFTFWMRQQLSTLLDMPYNKVRLINAYTGGSYGCHFTVYCTQYCAAILSRKLEKPVRIVNTREDNTSNVLGQNRMKATCKIGLKKDGTILARDIEVITDVGAYRAISALPIHMMMSYVTRLLYRVPNSRVGVKASVYTNKPPLGAYRGIGNQQVECATEVQQFWAAREMGLDPVDVWSKNAWTMEDRDAGDWSTSSCAFRDTIKAASERIGWKEKKGKSGQYRGIGIGSSHLFVSGTFSPEPIGCYVTLNGDGTVSFKIVANEGGQGQFHTLKIILAEAFGLPIEKINRAWMDTENFSGEFGGQAVNVCYAHGRAGLQAADKIKQKIFNTVAEKLEANPEDMVCRNESVYVKGSPDKGLSFQEAAQLTIEKEGGVYGGPITERGNSQVKAALGGREAFYRLAFQRGVFGVVDTWSYSTSCAEVVIDPETGRIKVEKTVFAQDCGTLLNPLGARSQLKEGTVSKLGHALYEEVTFKDGQNMVPDLLNYRLPLIVDMPEEMETHFVDSTDPLGPFGIKELAEGAMGCPTPAIVSAVYDATGVMLKEFPLTPEKIIKAIREKNA